MGSTGYDLVVIGSGPGGYKAAVTAAHLGARVALVERDLTGGNTVNQYRLGHPVVFLKQRALVLTTQVNAAVLDHHRTHGQNTVSVDVKSAGLQIHHDQATPLQRSVIQCLRGR